MNQPEKQQTQTTKQTTKQKTTGIQLLKQRLTESFTLLLLGWESLPEGSQQPNIGHSLTVGQACT